MKPAPFTYHAPRTLPDALQLLSTLDNARPLAGGQSLGPMLNMRFVMPDHLVDLNRVPGLDRIEARGDTLEIGAMVRQRALERSDVVRRACPVMIDALAHVGHFQTRNRGTLGGSLSHLDPAAELPGICALYDATLTAGSRRGEREVPMAQWGRGYMSPDLAPDELLLQIRLPLWREPHGHAFVEFARRRGDFAIAGAGALLALDANGRIARAAIVLIGVAYAPLRLTAAERALIGAAPDEDALGAAAAEAAGIEAIEDSYVSAGYRKRLAGVLAGRALDLAARRARQAGA
ncbi:MAG TPA: FAD binding domain-containing protein [Burkholderiales bacterium]|nr:FAD binding domain-containing protein [Burkholderiales bacterium]